MKQYGFLAMILWLAANTALLAHPHQYADVRLYLQSDAEGISGVRTEWILLKNYAQTIRYYYDKNQDDFFSPEEVRSIYNSAFAPLDVHYFYVHIKIGDRVYASLIAENFHAATWNDEVIFSFTIPCRIAWSHADQLELAVFDPGNFTSFDLLDCRMAQPYIGPEHTISFIPDPAIYSHGIDNMAVWARLHFDWPEYAETPEPETSTLVAESISIVPAATVNPFFGGN